MNTRESLFKGYYTSNYFMGFDPVTKKYERFVSYEEYSEYLDEYLKEQKEKENERS